MAGNLTRRNWLRWTAVLGAGGWTNVPSFFGSAAARAAQPDQKLPPCRAITKGPKFHWFGYYDKWQFDPTDRYVLGMEVDFEHRSPKPEDTVRIGMIDLADGDRWTELGTSTAWCWQQGCMLQWRPGFADEILWNDRQKDHYVCHILNVKTGQKRTLPMAIYAVSPDGRWAVSTDFRRLGDMRPGYGYNGIPAPYADQLAPKDSGIWRVDLETGKTELIISLADIVKLPFPHGQFGQAKHWFNHLLVNPDGSRFVFLHRWRLPEKPGHTTRMITAAPDGSDLRIIDDNGLTSHFIWRDPKHILVWTRKLKRDGFLLLEDRAGGSVEEVLMTGDGHCNYLPQRRWFVSDTYPDRERKQHLYLYDTERKERIPLGAFYQGPEYRQPPFHEWRCDLHPRISRTGRYICIDSVHEGGRQMYLIDISSIIRS